MHEHLTERLKVSRNGVLSLSGFGLSLRVDRGHLVCEDGVGAHRRFARFPRIGHGLKRLVIVGSDGAISLAAIRWLADQKAALVMLERDGSVLATTGPVRGSDARLRRSQADAAQSPLSLKICAEVIRLKLLGQEGVARDRFRDEAVANQIGTLREALDAAKTPEEIRILEARAASAYWSVWTALQVSFPKRDLVRCPDHWLTFGVRTSPLSGFSPRLAVNPVNAVLNYLYACLEAETRLAIAEMGLDPGMGFLHLDSDRRDSLACDLMEVARPKVDAFVLDWIGHTPLRRSWFFEQSDGNCRLMDEGTAALAYNSPRWRDAFAPTVEWLAKTLWQHAPKMAGHREPANRLTMSRKSTVHGGEGYSPLKLRRKLRESVKYAERSLWAQVRFAVSAQPRCRNTATDQLQNWVVTLLSPRNHRQAAPKLSGGTLKRSLGGLPPIIRLGWIRMCTSMRFCHVFQS